MKKKEDVKNDVILIRLPKEQKQKIFKVVEKSSYNNASELIRAGIEKELNLQMYKDNMDIIIKELSTLNTYVMGELMSEVMGDELHEKFIEILENGRVKANYFVNRNTEEISKEELLSFYGIGKVYRNE